MIRLFLSLTIISIVIVSIWSSDGYTVHNSLLTGHVFKTTESIDWLQCVEECHKHDECISYNYFPPKKICELNNFGYDNQCEAGNNVIRATGWIHHVLDISEEMKRKRKAGEVSNGKESKSVANFHFNPRFRTQENKAYMLQTDIGRIPVYCHMTGIDGCGDGGWTLIMKIDDRELTFHYDSQFWRSKTEFNRPGGATGFHNQETKLPTYWNTNFSKICLGMKIGNQSVKFLVISKNGTSLYSLIADGRYRGTSLGREKWKTLIGSEGSLQKWCNKEGFNAVGDRNVYSKARIGIIGNGKNHCLRCDSRIGFGTGGLHDDTNTCGNEATYDPDNGDKHIKTMGYILVK